MDDTLDLLTVRASATADVAADHADLAVTLKGSSLFTGDMALHKAHEIRQLAADLAKVGVDESEIQIQRIVLEKSSVGLSKGSSATYHLRIRASSLENLPNILGAITGQKAASIDSVIWGYPDLSPIQDQLLEQSVVRARQKATIMASALGCVLERVHSVTDTIGAGRSSDPNRPYDSIQPSVPALARQRMTTEDFGLAVSHTQEVHVTVEVRYRIGSGSAASAPSAAD